MRPILQDDVLTAVLSGEIDHHTAQGMREEIDFTVNQSKPKKLILSFEHVGFMDSAGIGLIIGRYKIDGKFGRRTGGFTLVSQNGTNCISVGCAENWRK